MRVPPPSPKRTNTNQLLGVVINLHTFYGRSSKKNEQENPILTTTIDRINFHKMSSWIDKKTSFLAIELDQVQYSAS